MTGMLLVRGSASHLPLASESVQTCVTSPPYWGLRQYSGEQREVWGGDPEHVHEWGVEGERRNRWAGDEDVSDKQASNRGNAYVASTGAFCACGAWYGALGLEPTPELYVEHMVAIFREVRRVLRKDGTLWLNVGSSYASGGTRPSQSLSGQRVSAYGTDGTEPEGWLAPGSAYSGLCDGCSDALSNRTARTRRPLHESALRSAPTGRGNEHQDSALEVPDASLRDVRASTTLESEPLLQGECSHCSNCGACLSVLRSASRDARLCARTMDGKYGTAQQRATSAGRTVDTGPSSKAWAHYTSTLRPKSLIPIPWMVAMSLQSDGWILRSAITWCKSAPMPESVTDRPTSATEMLFLFAKNERYFYDQEAVREPASENTHSRGSGIGVKNAAIPFGDGIKNNEDFASAINGPVAARNKRNWWVINPQPYSGAHFAVFPEALVEPCILAGSAAKACGVCGAPWERTFDSKRYTGNGDRNDSEDGRWESVRTTTGWTPTCAHTDGTGASLVLDPFNGSGTTGRVAVRHGRNYVGLDISDEYLRVQSKARIDNIQHVMGGL